MVKLEVAVEDLVALVTPTVVLSVIMTLGGTLVGNINLDVVVIFVAVVIVVVCVAADVALAVEVTCVVTSSWCVVGLSRAVEVVERWGDQGDGGWVVVAVVDISTFPVRGGAGVASVTRCGVIGLSVVVTTLCDKGTVVDGCWVVAFVTFACEISGGVIVVGIVVVVSVAMLATIFVVIAV